MFEGTCPVSGEAATDPSHLEGALDVVDLRQRPCTSAYNFHFLIKEPLYAIFSLKQKCNMKKFESK